MALHRYYRSTAFDLTGIEPIIRLWLLRLLVPLECHREFIGKQGFNSDEIAELFSLQADHCAAEDADVMDAADSTAQCFNAHFALTQLKRCYAEAQQNTDPVILPQPLEGNIQQLAVQMGLSAVECRILAFTVLINTNRLLNHACDWLGSAVGPLKVYHVLSVLLDVSEAEIRSALAIRSVLSQSALVVLIMNRRGDLGDQLDVLSKGFAGRLASEAGSPVDWLRDIVIPSQAPQLSLDDYPHLKESLDFMLPFLQTILSARKKGVNVFLYGVSGTGKTQLTRVLAKILDCRLYEIASEDEDGDPVDGEQRLRAFRIAQAFFQHSATLMLFDEVDDVFNDGNDLFGQKSTAQTRKAWINRLLEENPLPTFWLGNSIRSVDPAFIRRFDWVLELPVPPKAQRERIIRTSCGKILTEEAIKQLAACKELAPAVVTRAAQVIEPLSNQFSAERLSTALQLLIDKTLQAQGHPGLNKDNAVHLPDFYDLNLINCDADLKQIAEGILHHGSARICLFGPTGTGKSAYARWLSEQLDKPLHITRGADLLSKWVGGTEKNIARIFQDAEEDKAVLLIDEIDSFLQDRNLSQHSWEITGVNEMLTWMETYKGVFIASTNRLEGLDAASLRRFDLKIKFDALKPQQAWTLLQSYCQTLGFSTPDASLQNALQQLDTVTLGDFALLERQHRFSPLNNAQALVTALQAECALKIRYPRQAIGFI